MRTTDDTLDLLGDLIGRARAGGAEGADAVFVASRSLSLTRRLDRPEWLDRSESADVGLRVFMGRRQAIVSSSDLSPDALDDLVARVLTMARSVPEDPYCGLAEADLLAADRPDLDICDPAEPDADLLVAWASRAEEAARSVPGVTNSEGAEASWGRADVAIAASNGFTGVYATSRLDLSVSVLAGEGTAMERDYEYASAVFAGDLGRAEDIGRAAGEKAVGRLNPRKMETAQMPVVYDPRVARSLLFHLASAINGVSVARGTTFLKDRLEQEIFPASVTIVDDPRRRRGLRSKPFDGEGLATRRRNVIDNGVLATWILDLRSARQLGMASTGHAARGTSSPPSPAVTNLYLKPGGATPKELMADIKSGFYVTELIGFGVNGVTGDYSRGAAGFRIENGELAHPVSEVTVAGNLNDMFANITAADDLEFRYGIDAPTVRVEGMTVAGR